MSAKLLQVLTDDNPDLHKQIGCMTGIFQLFDRHHILTGKRFNGTSHKRLPSGHSHFKNGSVGAEANACSLQIAMEEDLSKNLSENQRASMESSRASFSSSSCSSSFSSLDCNKTAHLEPSFERTTFSERPLKNLQKLHNSENVDAQYVSAQSGRQSLDFRDVVKDSIYRDTYGLSLKTTTREEPANHIMKHRDSPRPLHLSKLVDKSYGGVKGKPRTPVDLDESLKVLAKLREAPWYFNEDRDSPRSSYETKDGSLHLLSKDAPRFSYDGREISRPSFDSRDTCKSATKLRELPRLSLDSRECSMRSSNFESKSTSMQRSSSTRAPNLESDLGTHKRPPSVVAKLMGLEAMPNSSSGDQEQLGLAKACSDRDQDAFYRPKSSNCFTKLSKTTNESKEDRIPSSPKSIVRDPVSPRLRNRDSVMKPISNSRLPIETAPWRQQDNSRNPPKTGFRNQEAYAGLPNSQSVYSEIEKRLKELEFQQSGKDLRALKQILDAMQAKGLLETKKEEDQASNFDVQRKQMGLNQNARTTNRQNTPSSRSGSAPTKGISTPRSFESPIVIMKPAKLIDRSSIQASSVIPFDGLPGISKFRSGDSVYGRKASVDSHMAKDPPAKLSLREPSIRILGSSDKKSSGNSEENSSQKPRLRSTQTHSKQFNKDTTGSSVSPRLQQRKLELEKKSRPPIPSSDSSKQRRKPVRQNSESGYPGGKLRQKSAHAPQNDDRLSEVSSSDTRNFSLQGDEISLQSDSNFSSASQVDIEVTSADRSADVNCDFLYQGSRKPSCKDPKNSVSKSKQKISPSSRLREDDSFAELAMVAPEQPSPVSVLDDAMFCRDDSPPSPVKKISNAFKDDGTQNSDDISGEYGWNPMGPDHSLDCSQHNFSSEIGHKKLENIERLVQKLRQVNSGHDESTTDYIASLCENTNPDHRYISEILLASGLLLEDLSSGPMPIQLHPSGYPINPNLFFVLEQTKASWVLKSESYRGKVPIQSKPDQEKLHRKLMFDMVNEILTRKLVLAGAEPWLRTNKLAGRNVSGQRLLRELCLEIEKLRSEGSESRLDNGDDGLKSIMWEDAMVWEESWTDLCNEVPGVVLDVERSIFKDLVDEIVSVEASGLRARQSRRCRQLFSK